MENVNTDAKVLKVKEISCATTSCSKSDQSAVTNTFYYNSKIKTDF